MQIPALDINLLILAVLAVGALYGAIGGKFHLRLLILSIYVGVVLAEQMSAAVRPYAPMLGVDQLNLLLLSLPILVFGFVPRGHRSSHAEQGSMIANLIVGLLTGALVAGAALHVLPTSQLAAAKNDSFLAMNLDQIYFWLLGLMPLVALVMGLFRPKDKH